MRSHIPQVVLSTSWCKSAKTQHLFSTNDFYLLWCKSANVIQASISFTDTASRNSESSSESNKSANLFTAKSTESTFLSESHFSGSQTIHPASLVFARLMLQPELLPPLVPWPTSSPTKQTQSIFYLYLFYIFARDWYIRGWNVRYKYHHFTTMVTEMGILYPQATMLYGATKSKA